MAKVISVPAGRCERRQGTKWIDPQPEKGLIELGIEDDLLHISWKSRATNVIEDDLIIFPGEASFEKVSQDASGRTHILKFSSSDQKYFFWFQRKNQAGDLRAQVDINELLQDPSYTPGTAALPQVVPETPAGSSSNLDRGEERSWPPTPGAPKLSHASPLPASSSSRAAAAGASTGGPSDPSAGVQASSGGNPQEEMARLLMQWAEAGGIPRAGSSDDASLTDVLSPANISALINAHPEIGERLAPLLPPSLGVTDKPTPADILPILTAPQFTDAIGSLDEALREGGLPGSMMVELGLPEGAGQSVHAFLEALRGLQGDEQDDKMETD